MSVKIRIFVILQLSIIVSGKDTKIIGGVDGEISNYPYLASLRRTTNEHMCGGAIISNRHILTAAHCFEDAYLSESNLRIYVGISRLSDYSGPSFVSEKVIKHPGFQGMLDYQSYLHDIAIVKVRGTIHFNRFQNKVKLPTSNIYTGSIGLLTGWGLKSYPSVQPSDQLQATWMIVYESYHCRNFFSVIVHIDQFCAFRKPGIGPCTGDSGGPLVHNDAVIGIVSTSVPCATGVPDIYTKVYSHLDFITTTLEIY